jgi:malate dehydrogenase (oxaloacetate-decarboxylating)
LLNPVLNKGTAFTAQERRDFALNGLLPPHVSTLHDQMHRRLLVFRALTDDRDKYVFLREIQDTNETLFYALLFDNLEEMLPLVYTPVVGYGCQQFSRLFRRPRGLFLSMPLEGEIKTILSHPRFDKIEAIVVTDGERVLGLGDQGIGGMGISIGKAAIYSSCAGLHPSTTLPVFLDVGTDNEGLLDDPLYLGWRHARVRGAAYDHFIETFVTAVNERWPHVLLQWEDFAKANAGRLLDRYRNRLCTFNDDIQGTAAAATGTLLSATNVTGIPLTNQKICIFGAGSAGCGIANLLRHTMIDAGLRDSEACARIYLVDINGLLTDGMADLSPFQKPFAKSAGDIDGWKLSNGNNISFLETVKNLHPTALIGVSGQAGIFTEAVVREMAAGAAQPVILPLSNPTSCSEATPEDLIKWTDGRAVIATGSPFPALLRDGRLVKVDQTNNTYIFPGVVLGSIASEARHISDGMFVAAAKALAAASPSLDDPNATLLPPITSLREVAVKIAHAVALQAQKEGLAALRNFSTLDEQIRSRQWSPAYSSYERPGAP